MSSSMLYLKSLYIWNIVFSALRAASSVHKCKLCNYTTRNKKYLNTHVKGQHEVNVYCCTLCRWNTCYRRVFNRHMRDHYDHKAKLISFSCTICEFTSPWKNCLKDHLKNMHGPRNFQCPYCPATFGVVRAKRQHMLSHSTKAYTCTWCPHRSSRKADVDRHEALKHRYTLVYFCSPKT